MNLKLRSSLFYEKIDKLPDNKGISEEFIQCFELNPAQAHSIEPEKEQLLGSLIFIGQKTEINEQELNVTLPEGNYLLEQCRKEDVLTRDEWLDLAVEQQKDGLWERNKLGNLLYVRFLFEDEAYVTQVFRTLL